MRIWLAHSSVRIVIVITVFAEKFEVKMALRRGIL